MTRTCIHSAVALLLLFSAGCGDKINPAIKCPTATHPVTYTSDIHQFVQSYCISCHSAGVSNRQGAPVSINFDTYDGVKDYGEQSRLDVLSGRMPVNSNLPTSVRCTFDAWVQGNYRP